MTASLNPLKGDEHWAGRRVTIMVTTLFYMGVIVFALYTKVDTRVAETACEMSFLALTANVGSYVFGASWEDITMSKLGFLRNNSPFRRQDDPCPVPPPAQ